MFTVGNISLELELELHYNLSTVNGYIPFACGEIQEKCFSCA